MATQHRRRWQQRRPLHSDCLLFPAVALLLLALIPGAFSLPLQLDDITPGSAPPAVLQRRQSSSNVTAPPDTTSSVNVTLTYATDCGFVGDQDMYGLGIRIGYYVQWVATVFGAYFTPKIVSSAFEANAIFNIGMLAGLVFSTLKRNNMYVVEPVMVLGFSIGGAIVGLLDPKNVHDPKSRESLRARLVHLCGTGALSLPLLVYWTWYSFYGMDTMNYNHCSTFTFFIVKIDIWSPWFRYFMKIATILSLVGLFSLGIAVVVSYRRRSVELPDQLTYRPRLSRSATALALRARPTKMQFFVVIFVCAICALSVELGIAWNNISSVNALGATGQLIPLAIGIITSVRVLIGVIGEHFKGRTERREEALQDSSFRGMGGGGMRGSMRGPDSGSRGGLPLDPADEFEASNYEVLDVRTLIKGGKDGKAGAPLRRASITTVPLGDKPKISPTSTSDSQESMKTFVGPSSRSVRSMKSTKSARSLKSTKSGKLTKEMKEKDRSAVESYRSSLTVFPTEPPPALTEGSVFAPTLSSAAGGKKKLRRDPNRRPE